MGVTKAIMKSKTADTQTLISDKIISIKEIREDAEIMERANINPNLPEVIFAEDVRSAVRKILEKIESYQGFITKDWVKEIIESEMGKELMNDI